MKRFIQWCAASHGHDMLPSESGAWVRHEDSVAESNKLLDDKIAAKLEVSELRHDIERHVSIASEQATEIEQLREWQRRAAHVLPLIPREHGTELGNEVAWLLRTEKTNSP